MCCKPACATCERLRAATLEIVGAGGTGALSEASLARRVGLAPIEMAKHYQTVAECLYETYDEVSAGVARELASACAEGSDWQSGFELSRRRLLERMAANPAEARLCFVETVRGNRELRRRRDAMRRSFVEFLAGEHRRRRDRESVPEIQIEFVIGAGFHAISSAVADGEPADLTELEPRLAALAGPFMLSAV